MTNTPTPRPDVERIEARAGRAARQPLFKYELLACSKRDIPALIAYIKALEAVMETLNKFDFQFFDNPKELWAELSKDLAALGDGDG